MQGQGSESAASPNNKVNGTPWNWVMRGVLGGGQLAPTTFSFCVSPPSLDYCDSVWIHSLASLPGEGGPWTKKCRVSTSDIEKEEFSKKKGKGEERQRGIGARFNFTYGSAGLVGHLKCNSSDPVSRPLAAQYLVTELTTR